MRHSTLIIEEMEMAKKQHVVVENMESPFNKLKQSTMEAVKQSSLEMGSSGSYPHTAGFPNDDEMEIPEMKQTGADRLLFTKPSYAAHTLQPQAKPKRVTGVAKSAPEWQGLTDNMRVFTPSMEVISEGARSLTPSDSEDFNDLKASFKVWRIPEPTIVLAIVVDKENVEANTPAAIRCYGGSPFGGYVHDLSRDSYLVQCIEFLQVGVLPFHFMITLPNIGEWKMKVPMPENIIEKHLPPQNLKLLSDYRAKYDSKRFSIQFIQMVGCHG